MKNLFEVLERLEIEDDQQREKNLQSTERNRSIPRDVGEYLSVFLRAMKPKLIVEVGTSVGYSTLWLGMSAKSFGGKVISYEIDSERANKAKQNITEAGLSDVIEIIHSDFNFAEIPNNIDFVFFDQEKSDYVPHFKKIFSKINPGGVIIADNVISHFEELRLYIELVRDNKECDSVMNPIGNGLEVTYKHNTNEFPAFKELTLVR
jgi:caffeoyl-CoA O-methyltransferase